MYAISLRQYAYKLKIDYNNDTYNIKHFKNCKELLKNIQFLEESYNGSPELLILIQRLKIITRDKLNEIRLFLNQN